MTRAGLLGYMDAHGIDKSVVLSIATKPTQVGKINAWASAIASDRLIPFGAAFPMAEGWRADIDDIVARGFKGIKLHPEYQGFYVDDESLFPFYEYAFSKGLIILWHAGYDPVGTPPYRSNPRRFAALADRFDGARLQGLSQTFTAFKPQIDFCRLLKGQSLIFTKPAKQQLLGGMSQSDYAEGGAAGPKMQPSEISGAFLRTQRTYATRRKRHVHQPQTERTRHSEPFDRQGAAF